MFPTRILMSAALISTALAGPWANICASRSSNEIRTCDSYGCGQYSTQRTQRHHPGVDVLCSDGSVVYAPFTGKIVGQEKPYRNKNAINDGVRLSGRGPRLQAHTTTLSVFTGYRDKTQIPGPAGFLRQNFLH
uniref:Leukocyte cell-derived chemotaxin 2 n=1 Tax=Rattus norvegicus TaxID=10116 RepID=A0A8I6AA90_RAT